MGTHPLRAGHNPGHLSRWSAEKCQPIAAYSGGECEIVAESGVACWPREKGEPVSADGVESMEVAAETLKQSGPKHSANFYFEQFGQPGIWAVRPCYLSKLGCEH
jgi:hypothetical protein